MERTEIASAIVFASGVDHCRSEDKSRVELRGRAMLLGAWASATLVAGQISLMSTCSLSSEDDPP